MSRLRRTLAALLVASTALFAVGVSAERSESDTLVVAAIALVWALLDVREVVHQLDESHTGVALVAMSVAGLHLAAVVVSGRLARQTGAQSP